MIFVCVCGGGGFSGQDFFFSCDRRLPFHVHICIKCTTYYHAEMYLL